MAAPLAGIVVIEASQVISGPLAGMLLALQGADVIKIEPPGVGDPTRVSGDRAGGVGAMFANCNRGKRSVVLDATDPRGYELVAALVERADVFTQNFRPGKAAKMGLGPEAMLERNPSLVYASIYGYGPDGPHAGDKVYDFVIQAVSGLADSQRGQGSGPGLVRNYVMDKASAYHAAQAVTAALLARERDPERRGQHVEVSMLDVGLEFFWPEGMMSHTYLEPDERLPLNLDFYDTYPTVDGALALYPIIPGSFVGLCRACGHEEWTRDDRFMDLWDRRRNMAAFVELVAGALAAMTTADALERLQRNDVAVAEVVPMAEVHRHPQVLHNRALVERVDPLVGPVRVPRHASRFGRTPAEPPGDVPGHGQHTVEVLSGLGLAEGEIAELQRRGVAGGPPLASAAPAAGSGAR
jgi:crotonobetainyl-CoA:carnitine CoA-transferase CaiB-like acyl-CoA transferase